MNYGVVLNILVNVYLFIIANKPKLQLAAVYALQMSCNALSFPKGLLLRSFVNFYEMDIVDEHAFLQWKEDVNESYPGKGKALFQVKYFFQFKTITPCFNRFRYVKLFF